MLLFEPDPIPTPRPHQTNPARRAHAPHLARPLRRPATPARPRQTPPPRHRKRRPRLHDLLGPTRRRQNHPRQDHRPAHPGLLHRVLRRPLRHQGDQAGHGRRRQGLPAYGSRTILFIDEIHRFNKAQQDAFLPYVERGTIRLIGATTENPSFEINAALLSRCRVYTLLAPGPRRHPPAPETRPPHS